MAKRFISEGDAETKRQKAIEFLGRVGGDVEKFEAMSTAEYARSRGFELLPNPATRRITLTKVEMSETLDQIADGLDECLDAELSREELVGKIKELSDLAAGEEPDEESDQDASDEN